MVSGATPAPRMEAQKPDSPAPHQLEDGADSTTRSVTTKETARPMVRFDSPSWLLKSLWARFASIWTKRFVLSLLAGQLVSLCITCTDVTTTELVNRGWVLPTTQTLFLYFTLFVVYTPYTIYKYGFVGWGKVVFYDGWKYCILATCDVEGNFLVVKAFQYTDLLSCMLLNSWAIPTCMFFSFFLMRTRYTWTQLAGILICICGLVMLVVSDQLTANGGHEVHDKAKGDLFMVIGATLYGISNATEEFLVRKSPLYEVLGQLGMWGTLIIGTQAAVLEHKAIVNVPWNGPIAGLLLAYTTALFIFYTMAPIVYRLASAVFYNLSLLSANFFGLLFGLFLFHYRPFWLYFVAFPVIIAGLVCYFWSATPESQGNVDPRSPSYIHQEDDKKDSPAGRG
ncbi:DUF914-domain-containing protein [Thelephora terrestris]|uniref:DUF914-domain-containing protein n=1 Tax=Thelephora terrestris TaxID=56493 RepID=A0A9P6HFW4_9AGAM|nr:DUF914-domain-containing protein [Thelephora terrestris]